MPSIVQKILLSLAIDIQWLTTPGIPYKLRYLWKKYLFLCFSFAFWDAKSHSYRLSLFGQTMHIPNREHIAFLQGTFTDHAYLQTYIAPGATIIDIGAHVGEFALVCSTCLAAKDIFSFEPVKYPYELLSLNTRFHTFHAAVGNGNEVTMYIPQNTLTSSIFKTSQNDTVEVLSCISPDTLPEIASLPHIDLFKIDVEGMEYDVISASKETIRKSSHILVELSLNRPCTKSALDTIALLKEFIPDIQLLHVGTVFTIHTNQVAVDMLFSNPSQRKR